MAFTKRELRIVEPLCSLLDLMDQPAPRRDDLEDMRHYRQAIGGKMEELREVLRTLEDEEEV